MFTKKYNRSPSLIKLSLKNIKLISFILKFSNRSLAPISGVAKSVAQEIKLVWHNERIFTFTMNIMKVFTYLSQVLVECCHTYDIDSSIPQT